jgi:CheY-like chemotaxis protein
MEALQPSGATILVAGTPEGIVTAKHALGTAFDYLPAHNVDEALSFLSAHVDVIVCDVAFDSSRMFDFVHAARQVPAVRPIPIVCFRHQTRPLTRTTHEAIENALGVFCLTRFVDLYALTVQVSVSHALSAFRAAVLGALEIEARVSVRPAATEASGV